MTQKPHLAVYASHATESRGRAQAEPESATRTCFQRDRDRIVHSTGFRRLQYKTQVFVSHEGDHYRTRLTHSLEVAQIARSLARTLALDEDLAEALALAHDLGHPPFGHAGEEALDRAMAPYGGFDHNEQTFRVLTKLERHYAQFDGLNLTWETLEGVAKHNGPLSGPQAEARAVPPSIAAIDADFGLDLDSYPGIEAQVAAQADDIAYNNHDIDDGLRAGLFALGDLEQLPLVGPIFGQVAAEHPNLERPRLIHESIRRLITHMVEDLVAETRRRLALARPKSAAALRALDHPVVAFSAPMRENDRALKGFLFERMYRHERVNRMTAKARRIVADLFGAYLERGELLPAEWRAAARDLGWDARARLIGDYIAGMTDRFAANEHRAIFGASDSTNLGSDL
jgi:dGTPase